MQDPVDPSHHPGKKRASRALVAPLDVDLSRLPLADSAEPADRDEILRCGRILWRRKTVVLATAAACLLVAIVAALLRAEVYQARVSIEIQELNADFLNRRDVDPTATASAYTTDAYLQSQINILQSDSLIERTIVKIKLDEQLDALRQGPSLLQRMFGNLHLQERLVSFLRVPGHLRMWLRVVRWVPPGLLSPQDRALMQVKKNLSVRSTPQGTIVDVLYAAPDARLAADFANTLAEEFIEQNLEVRWSATQHTGEWLSRQTADMQAKLERSEDALQSYANAHGLMFIRERENVAEDKLRQLQSDLSSAQSDRIVKQSLFETARTAAPASLPKIVDDPRLSDYQAALTDLRRQVAQLSTSLTPAHYKVKRLQAQISELESTIALRRQNILDQIDNEYKAAQKREALLAAAYATQSRIVSEQAATAIHYDALQREVETDRQMVNTMTQKVKEAGIAAALRATNLRVVDRAKPPLLPYEPNLHLYWGVGLLAGLVLGAAVALFREHTDWCLHAPGDALAHVRLPELGAIPCARLAVSEGIPRVWRRRVALLPAAASSLEGVPDRVELITWQRKPCFVAEAFRSASASLMFSSGNGWRPRVVTLSSPNSYEGKTTVATNLGIALAETGKRVLLIDADMRRPQVNDIFRLPNSWGLSDVIRDRLPLSKCSVDLLVRKVGIPNLFVLPSGPAVADVSGLLYSARMSELIGRFRQEFDLVLIDTPSLMQFSDARVVSKLSDGVILVFRAGRTLCGSAQAVAQRYHQDGTRILGTILNQWAPAKAAARDYTNYFTGGGHNGASSEPA